MGPLEIMSVRPAGSVEGSMLQVRIQIVHVVKKRRLGLYFFSLLMTCLMYGWRPRKNEGCLVRIIGRSVRTKTASFILQRFWRVPPTTTHTQTQDIICVWHFLPAFIPDSALERLRAKSEFLYVAVSWSRAPLKQTFAVY